MKTTVDKLSKKCAIFDFESRRTSLTKILGCVSEAQDIKNLDNLCISSEEKKQRIKELKRLNLSIAYSSNTLHYFWQHENMLSYKRDQVYDLWDMIGN